MKAFTLLLIAVTVFATGCMTPNAKRFSNSDRSDIQTVRLVSIEDNKLQVQVSQNLAPAYLADVRAKIIVDGVYLFPTYISTVVGRFDFDVSLPDQQLPDGWKERIYWVDGELIPSPLNPFAERVHVIDRRHLSLADTTNQPGAQPVEEGNAF